MAPCVATCFRGGKFKLLIKVATIGPDAPKSMDIVEDTTPPININFLPSWGNFPNIEYKINTPTPIWPRDGEMFSTIFAPKYDPSNVPRIKGMISFTSTSLKETNILEKFDPNCITPWTGTRARGGRKKDKLTSIKIPPPKLRAVEINAHNKFIKIKKTPW